MSEPSNGKTYTEVVAEVNASLADMRVEFIDRINDSDKHILEKLDDIHSAQARGDEKFVAIENKIDGKGGVNERIDVLVTDTKANARNIKVVGAFEAALLVVCGWVGINK